MLSYLLFYKKFYSLIKVIIRQHKKKICNNKRDIIVFIIMKSNKKTKKRFILFCVSIPRPILNLIKNGIFQSIFTQSSFIASYIVTEILFFRIIVFHRPSEFHRQLFEYNRFIWPIIRLAITSDNISRNQTLLERISETGREELEVWLSVLPIILCLFLDICIYIQVANCHDSQA